MPTTATHYQYALERVERHRTEAAAFRLAEIAPLRTRIAQLLVRAADRVDRAHTNARALPERG